MRRILANPIGLGALLLSLSLGLFGCPQAGVDDATTGAPLSNDTGGAIPGFGSVFPGLGGAGGNAGAGEINRSAVVRPASPTLFIADNNDGVMSFANAGALNGNVPPTTFIDRIKFPPDFGQGWAVAVDRVGSLIVHELDADALLFYNHADAVTGAPAPSRRIQGPGTRIADRLPGGLAVDRENDRLFVATSDRVLIFEGAALSMTGDVAPTRFFSSVDLPTGGSIALGPNGDLYVNDTLGQDILVFSNAGLRTGEVRPERMIDLKFFNADAIFVDRQDRLFVADNDSIAVVENASTLSGEIEGFREMRLAGARAIDEERSVTPCIFSLAVDAGGIGYACDFCNAAIHVIDNIATRTGDIRADRAITGPATEFNTPIAVFLWE